jgi:hypothetical protein
MVDTMDETRFRILDTLSRELGRPLSISELTSRIKALHGTAYYANTYDEVMSLAGEGIIGLEKIGNSSIANLNFRSYLLIDTLAEIELKKKHALLKGRTELQMLLMQFDTHLKSLPLVGSICMSGPEKSMKLNRMEFLILLRGSAGDRAIREHRRALRTDKIAFFNPQEFWIGIREALIKGVRVRVDSGETDPTRISERQLVFNLARFGYTEMGREVKEGERIGIEYIISSILLGKDVRRTEAIPVIIAKNKLNYNVLTFLSHKYKYSGRLLGLLRTLYKIKPSQETKEGISTLESMHVNEIEADEDSIREKMRLYNAT